MKPRISVKVRIRIVPRPFVVANSFLFNESDSRNTRRIGLIKKPWGRSEMTGGQIRCLNEISAVRGRLNNEENPNR
jgi:hypothetical protein